MNDKVSIEVLTSREQDAGSHTYTASAQATILECLNENEVEISQTCGAMGTCGTCRVEVLSSLKELPERNEIEIEMAESRAFEAHERLACQTNVVRNLKIKIPDHSI